jgi:capsular exopolysaccharide synthesis family protein
MWAESWSTRSDDERTRPFNYQPETPVAELLFGSFRVMRRRAWVAVATFVLFAVPAAIFVHGRPPIYQATARILLERNDEVASVLKERIDPAASTYFQTQTQILRSRPLVGKTIEKLKLWEFPQFARAMTPKDGPRSSPALIEAFLGHLTTAPTPGTQLLSVTFNASDPTLAMKAANTLTETYIEEQNKAHTEESSEASDWINGRLSEQRRRLDSSESSLQKYMESHDAVSVQDRQNIVVQKLGDLNTALTRAKTDRMAKEATFEQLKSFQENPAALNSLPMVMSNDVLQGLRGQLAELRKKEMAMGQELGDRHPDMVKTRGEIGLVENSLRTELAKLTESVKHDYEESQAVEDNLMRALDQQKREVLALNRKSLEYGALQRQATSDRQIYEQLLNQSQTKGVTGNTPETRVKILEPAEVPTAPIGPSNGRDLLLVIAAGLVLALGAPLIVETFDRRLKTPVDVEQQLRLRCIAMVPSLNGRGGKDPTLVNDDTTAFNEAFRRIRTSVALSHGHHGISRVLVTSTAPQEGKSLVAANLAVALARTGQRVLLVDGDLRRPVLHKTFGLKSSPGLSDLLTRTADAGAAIHQTQNPNLFVLPCGSKHPAAAELLSSPSLPSLLNALDSKFNWIVLDSPPIGPVSDACIIAPLVQRTLVVVSADATLSAAAEAAVDQLKAAGAAQPSAVLNRVDLKNSAYYYAPYHYKEYALYHSTSTQAVIESEEVGSPS